MSREYNQKERELMMKSMGKLLVTLASCIVLLGTTATANATKVEYTVSGGGNTLNFKVFNDTLGTPISFFDIYFGETTDGLNFSKADAFVSVSDGTAPAGWASWASPFTTLNNPWMYSAGVDVGGSPIGAGESLGGFSTTFALSGTVSLDLLWFNVYDEAFNTIDGGNISLHQNGGVVPEPSTMLLFGAGLAGLACYLRKKR